jgi:nicotinamidase-related amidase
MLPLPSFFDPARAVDSAHRARAPELLASARRWARRHRLKGAGEDGRRTVLLIVDMQKDFCLPEGALFVAGRDGRGAVGDCERLAGFIYRNLSCISETVCTLDTHLPHQIFFASFWESADGGSVDEYRTVTAEELRRGELRPRAELAHWLAAGDRAWLEAYVEHYCRRLEEDGRYQLYLWPPHCLQGSTGHELHALIEEARLFHAFARTAPARIVSKGSHPLTEHYSVFRPEVMVDHRGEPLRGGGGEDPLALLSADRLIVAGEAASHCVKSTLDDLIEAIAAHDPALAKRVFILEDCMSAVTVRGEGADEGVFVADFSPDAAAAIERCRRVGMNVVGSDVPMEEWSS